MEFNIRNDRERGAALVEFALIVPLLLTLVLGIIDFGVRFEEEARVNNAAFIAARSLSIHKPFAEAQADANAAYPGAGDAMVAVPAGDCVAPENVRVTIEISRPYITGFLVFLEDPYTIEAEGVARCDG